ncbi:MAG: iron ABC transporter permease, partial [Alphaproteobacteria bacterium]|nr:iron ABC transporter permease [Alphaproteobacteria bacterium]
SANYVRFFAEPYYHQTLINSFLVSGLATLFALLVGVPAAYLVGRTDIWGKTVIRAAVVLTFVSPPFIGSYSWVLLFGRSGVISSFLAEYGLVLPSIYGAPGIVLVFTLQYFPFVFLMVLAGLKTIDQSIEDAARNVGSNGWRCFWTVLVPLLVPSIATGALLVFVAAFSDFGTPVIIGEKFRVLPILVYSEFVNDFGGTPALASTLAVFLLLTTTAALLLQRWLSQRFAFGAQTIRPLEIRPLRPVWRVLGTAYVYLLLALALLPIGNIVVSSFLRAKGPIFQAEFTLENYAKIAGVLASPLKNTLVFTTVATLLCAIIGTMIAYVVVRRPSRTAALLDQGVMLSYAVPGIVLAIGLVITFHEPPLALTGTAAIVVLAYFIRRLPFSVRSAASMLQQLSPDVEEASVNLGASPARTFARVTVPLVAPAILSGALLTWANTIRELSATLILQSGSTATVSVEIFNEVVNANFGFASALGTILIALTFVPLAILFQALGRCDDIMI